MFLLEGTDEEVRQENHESTDKRKIKKKENRCYKSCRIREKTKTYLHEDFPEKILLE